MRTVIAVIAGNKREYMDFIRDHSLKLSEAIYLCKESDLSGHFVKDVAYVGSYRDNPFYSHPYRDFILNAHR